MSTAGRELDVALAAAIEGKRVARLSRRYYVALESPSAQALAKVASLHLRGIEVAVALELVLRCRRVRRRRGRAGVLEVCDVLAR